MQTPPPGQPPRPGSGPPYQPPGGQRPGSYPPPSPGRTTIPGGPPPGGAVPGGPGGAPRPGPAQPPPPSYAASPQAAFPAPPVAPPPPPAKRRTILRVFAVVCYVSAWLTLVSSIGLSVVYLVEGVAISSLLSSLTPPASPSMPTLPGGGGQLPGEDGSMPGMGNFPGMPSTPGLPGAPASNPLSNPMFRGILQALVFIWAGVMFVSGLLGWLVQLALGQACHTLVDLEEQNYRNAQALHLIMSRLAAR